MTALCILVPLNTTAQPVVGGAIHGTGTATTFQVFKDGGSTFQGGAYHQNIACTVCNIKIQLAASSITVVQDGSVVTLTPGAYEIREFEGTFSYTSRGLGNFAVQIEGSASGVYALTG